MPCSGEETLLRVLDVEFKKKELGQFFTFDSCYYDSKVIENTKKCLKLAYVHNLGNNYSLNLLIVTNIKGPIHAQNQQQQLSIFNDFSAKVNPEIVQNRNFT